MTEVWFRDPVRYMPALVEAGAHRIVWHRGMLIKRRVNPVAHAQVFFPAGTPWRVMSVGQQGALEWTNESRNDADPVACYPSWHYGEPLERLEALLQADVPGEPWDGPERFYRPRKGQERRVMIIGWPGLNELAGRRLLDMLGGLQEDYPETRLHLFEARYFRAAFAYGLQAVDLEPISDARFKRIHLPNGRLVHVEKLPTAARQWINMLGFSVSELMEQEERVKYNIRSALWAGENFLKSTRFRSRGSLLPEDFDPNDEEVQAQRVKSPHARATVGDKVACDHCSLFYNCKAARVGGVCTLPGTETSHLAKYFKTRDSDRIMEGLGELLAHQAERVERAAEWERDNGELDPELTKILAAMFDGGVKLAKLTNPALTGGPKIAVQINQGGGMSQITAVNPASLMGAIVRELEENGVPREEITPEMVMKLVQRSEPEAIEASSHDAA